MIGGIYTDEKCPVCGEKLKDNHKDGCTCRNHPNIYAKSVSVRFKKTHLRFTNYTEADQELSALRHNFRHYDPRDYQKKRPLALSNLSKEYLATKKGLASYGHIACNLQRAIDFFESKDHIRTIKDIWDEDLEDFADSLNLASKTKHNIISDLKACFVWIWERNRRVFSKNDFPKFPTVSFETEPQIPMSKDGQLAILEWLEKNAPVRVWLAIRWLVGHPKVRPGDILRVTEGDVLRDMGIVLIRRPKERRPKFVYLLQKDIDVINTLPLAMPNMPFFRHEKRWSTTREGEVFGHKYLKKWWNRGKKALGIEGPQLYVGTKHTSITGLNRDGISPEDIQLNSSGHLSKAMYNYLQSDIERQKELTAMCLGEGDISGKDLVKVFDGSRNINY